jgi:DNA-directed RNA polymerase specialized sigma24 family protein
VIEVNEREAQELYAQLEPWAVSLAVAVSRSAGLQRWAEDIEQEARIALWESIQQFNGNGSGIGFIKQRTRQRVLNCLRRYRRWDDREWTILQDTLRQLDDGSN